MSDPVRPRTGDYCHCGGASHSVLWCLATDL